MAFAWFVPSNSGLFQPFFKLSRAEVPTAELQRGRPDYQINLNIDYNYDRL